jgi:hypothetical protein
LSSILRVYVEIDVIHEETVEGVGFDPILEMTDQSFRDGAFEMAVESLYLDILADFPDVHPPLDFLRVASQPLSFRFADLHHFP